MNLLQRALRPGSGRTEQRFNWDDYAKTVGDFGFGSGLTLTDKGQPAEKVEANFQGLVQGALKRNGVIFACELARISVFSEARFQFRRLRNGRPGDLFGTSALSILERPWAGATTGDLLTRMLLDADFAGTAYVNRRQVPGRGERLRRLRPDWVTIVMGSYEDPGMDAWDLDSDLLGYIYQPGGFASNAEAEILLPDEVAQFSPFPDPMANYRGMSWLQPVIRELQADGSATDHKLKFFEHGATPNLVVSVDSKVSLDNFKKFKAAMDHEHAGVLNAYKTLYLGGGADAKVVGADFRQLDFKVTQGGGETRIAAAAGVPPIIVGLSEGLASATYSNYGQARRRYADGTVRPLWRNAAGSLAAIVPPPQDSELWFDTRDVAFLREDSKDAATIQQTKANTVRTLVDAGYKPETVVAAVEAEDMTLLEHSGLYSVMLQPAGTGEPGTAPKATPTEPDAKGDPASAGE
ncbi:MAG: phage portal protein [Candidatus Nanopelagicales bacterium]